MHQTTLSRKELQKELRKFISVFRASNAVEDIDDEEQHTAPVPMEYERLATFASASISALISTAAGVEFRFQVSLEPIADEDDEGAYSFMVTQDFSHAIVKIHRVHKRLLDAPEEYKAMIFLYLCACIYCTEYQEFNPEHDWGIKNPTERLALDAFYNVTDAQRAAARRSIFN